MFKRVFVAAAIVVAATGASAGALIFDPTGAGGSTGAFTVDRLDWNPSGVLAVGGNRAIANFLNNAANLTAQPASTSFQVLSHATLAGGSLNNVGVFSTTGQSYEITAVLGFHEKVVAATAPNQFTGGGATFAFDNTMPTFVRLYAGSPDANQLAGTGFNNGTLIFESVVSTVFGQFTTQLDPVTALLDQSGNGDNWSGQQTVTGSGVNTDVSVTTTAPTFIDENFFKNAPLLKFLFTNLSLNVPFSTTDPSYAFTLGDNSLYYVTTDNGVSSTLGTLNGGLSLVDGRWVASGPDFMFQTDVNSAVQGTPVPEPSTLVLVGLALAGLGFAGSRVRKASR